MEDPWANAWEEPTKPPSNSQNIWTRPRDAETDIDMPFWATGNVVDPADTQQSLWNAQLPAKDWNPSPYDTISLGMSSQVESSQPDRTPSSIAAEEISSPPPVSLAPDVQSLEPANFPDDDEPQIARSRSRSPTPSSHGSPDAFGTFETGLDVDGAGVDPWGHSADFPAPVSSETDSWVPTWGEEKPKAEVKVDSEHVDEWEAAKQRKERQDRHVVR
jgi:hypothetical protein